MTGPRTRGLAAALLLTITAVTGCSVSEAAPPPSPVVTAAETAGDSVTGSVAPSTTERVPAPAFTGQTITGGTIDSVELSRSGPAVLIFFSSWCQVCADSQSEWNDLATRYAGRATVVGVVADEKAAELSGYLAAHPVDFPVISDPDREIWRSFAVYEPPMVVLIGTGGTLVRGWPGGVGAETVSAALDEAIAS